MVNFKQAATTLQKLFVYGTLKSGEANHNILQSTTNGVAKYWCKATTTKKMPLVIGTRYNIPFLLNKPGVGSYVTGEIYEVDEQMMEILDNLEDCQRLYKRDTQLMNMGIGDGNVLCNVFLLDKYPEHLLDLPYLTEYKNSHEHPYVKKSLRSKGLGEEDFTPASAAA